MVLMILGIPIEVCRKRIKNLHLYVKAPNGHVKVSSPLSVSDDAIERFVCSKFDWIEKQITRLKDLPRKAELKYISGESIYVWGKSYILNVVYGKKYKLELFDDNAILTIKKESTIKQRERFVREWYRCILRQEIEKLLPKWEEITCLKAAGWQTKIMKTRWGTCNYKTHRLWFNVQLAQKSPICLEYIILHELIHITERLHGKRFALLMDTYMPIWRDVKAMLNSSDSNII